MLDNLKRERAAALLTLLVMTVLGLIVGFVVAWSSGERSFGVVVGMFIGSGGWGYGSGRVAGWIDGRVSGWKDGAKAAALNEFGGPND
jgi:hypothetical protein